MNKFSDKVVAITGASSGIGEATAIRLAKEGATVVLGARRTDRLEKIVRAIKSDGGNAAFTPLDVTNKQSVAEFIQFAIETYGHLDVLINNAGVMPLSLLAEGKVSEWESMIDVNIKGVLFGIAAALPIFTEQQSGHFIQITSIADRLIFPASAVYSGTKHAVRAITDGLRQEVGEHIKVTLIAPGATESELTNAISNQELKQSMQEIISNALPADCIAEAISYAIGQPKLVDVSEMVMRPKPSAL